MSHDLRGPLRSIDGFSQALLEDYGGALDATGQDYLRRVRAAAQRMGELIDDLLQLSRIDRLDMCREPIDLAAIARTVVADLRQQQPYDGVEIVLPDTLTIRADGALLRIVLENLLGNALKFSAKNPKPRVELGTVATPEGPACFVCDNGVGFDMRYAAKLFGVFQRLHAQEAFPGTGIGLATVQRIIHRHGGRIWAESRPGAGATFHFTV